HASTLPPRGDGRALGSACSRMGRNFKRTGVRSRSSSAAAAFGRGNGHRAELAGAGGKHRPPLDHPTHGPGAPSLSRLPLYATEPSLTEPPKRSTKAPASLDGTRPRPGHPDLAGPAGSALPLKAPSSRGPIEHSLAGLHPALYVGSGAIGFARREGDWPCLLPTARPPRSAAPPSSSSNAPPRRRAAPSLARRSS